jgi:hypothetical protein
MLMLIICKLQVSRYTVARCVISSETAESDSALYAFFFIYNYEGDIFYENESKQNASHVQINIVENIQLCNLLLKFLCCCTY